MRSKKEMLRRAAAFVSALSFLSVSNMGALSAFADEDGTSSPTASSAVASESVTSEKSGADPSAAKNGTTSTQTTTTTTTTAATTTTIATTTYKTIEKTLMFPSEMGGPSNLLYEDIKPKLESVKDKLIEYRPDNYTTPNNIYLKYKENYEADIKAALEREPYEFPKDEGSNNNQDKYDRYVVNFNNSQIEMHTIYRVDTNRNDLLKGDKFIARNGRYYIEKGTVLDESYFDLSATKYVDICVDYKGEKHNTVDGVVKIEQNGVKVNNANALEFKDKMFKINFTLNGVETVNYNPIEGIKWEDIDKEIKFKPKAGSDSVKFVIKGTGKEYKFEGRNKEKAVKVREILGSQLTTDNINDKDHVFTVQADGVPETITAAVTYVNAKGIKNTVEEPKELNGKNSIDVDYIYQDADGITYYLAYCYYKYERASMPCEEKYDSYSDLSEELEKNNKLLNEIPWREGLAELDYKENPGKKFKLILEYKEIASKETDENKIMDKFFAGAGKTAYKRAENVIGREKTSRINFSFDEGTFDEKIKFIVTSEDNEYHKIPLADNSFDANTFKSKNYIKFIAAEDKDGNVIPMEQFIVYLDNTAPKLAKDDNESGWKKERSFTLKISDLVGDSNIDNAVGGGTNGNSISKITIGGAEFTKSGKAAWAKGKELTVSNDAEGNALGYTVKLTPDTNEKGEDIFKVKISLEKNSIEGIDDKFKITAADHTGKESNAEEAHVQLDICKPEMTKLKVQGLNEYDIIDNENGRKIKAEAAAADNKNGQEHYSGIDKIVFHYEKPNDKNIISVNDFKYDHKFDSSDELTFGRENINGYLVADVIDKAGNTEYYYYSRTAEGNFTKNSSEATLIRSDNAHPKLPKMGYSSTGKEIDNKLWFGEYPTIKFSAADDDADTSTGISKIKIEINNISRVIELSELISADEEDPLDAVKALKNGDFSITFEKNTKNPTVYTPHLHVKGYTLETDPLAGTEVELPSDGQLNVTITSWDKADNKCKGNIDNRDVECASLQCYVDVTAPTVMGTFEAVEDSSYNYPAYGSYANKSVKIRIPIKDVLVDDKGNEKKVGSSGFDYADVDIIYLDKNNDAIDTKSVPKEAVTIDNDMITVTVPESEVETDSAKRFNIQVRIHDKVGNVSKPTVVKNIKNNKELFVVDKKQPVLSEIRIESANDDPHFVNASLGSECWVNGDVKVSCDINDEDSGLASAHAAGGKEDKEWKYTDESDVMIGDTYSSFTDENRDGRYSFEFTAADNAGNSGNAHAAVNKDTAAPVITEFKFADNDKTKLIDKNGMVDGNNRDRYSNFSSKEVEMSITAQDYGWSSGIKCICVQMYLPDGTPCNPDGSPSNKPVTLPCSGKSSAAYKEEEKENEIVTETVSLSIPVDFKGDITAWAVDNVEWNSDVKSPKGFVSENDTRHQERTEIKIERPQTDKKDNKGRDLYNSDVELTITVSDPHTGIRDIEWNAPEQKGSVNINADGGFDNETGEGEKWSSEDKDKDRNLLTKAVKKINVNKNDNGNEVTVNMHDYAENFKEGKDTFSIDTKKPVIKVEGIDASENIQYYNTHKTAKVTITERNFTAPVVNGSADNGFRHDGSTPEDSENTAYQKEFPFNSDGRYTLDITETDLAGNAAEKEYHSGTFVIDTTDPKAAINVTKVGGGNVRTGENAYVDSDVNVSVTVEEVNFDPDKVEITINGKAFRPGSWSGGASHTASIPTSNFSKDGHYTISISGKDLAGNTLKPVSASFTVDKKKPEIKITGVSSANNGDVAPVINITDDNLEAQDVKVYKNGKLLNSTVEKDGEAVSYDVKGGKKIIGRWSTENLQNGVKKKMIFDNFPSEEEYDGSYRIDVESKDMADNEEAQSLDFSVNRFGSVFTIEKAEEINGKYLSKAPTVIITETNVDKHKSDDEVVIIVDKGSNTVELTEGQYVVSGPEQLEDKSGYKYTYTIDSKNFDQDLEYNISIQSVDAAGNKNVSSGRGAELSFSVDTHEPEFKCDELIDRAEFRESQREFKLNVNEKLKHVKVTTSLNEVLLDQDGNDSGDNSYTFALPASNTSRDLTVELTDLAGNKSSKTFSNLLVTENIALYVMHKTWAKAGAAAAAAIAAAAGGILFVKKRKNG